MAFPQESGFLCPACGRGALESGVGRSLGLFVCGSCGYRVGRLMLAVDLLNAGRGLVESASAAGLSVADVESCLRLGFRCDRSDGRPRWVESPAGGVLSGRMPAVVPAGGGRG